MVDIEKVEPEWYDQALMQPNDRIERMKVKGQRFYRREGDETLYRSVTTIIDAQTKIDDGQLRNYVCRFPSYDAYRRDLNDRADRGTVMHALFAEMAKGFIDFPIESPEFRGHVCGLIESCNRDPEFYWPKWEQFMKFSLYAFLRWVHEKEVTFFAIEIPLISEEWHMGSQLDKVGLFSYRNKPKLNITDFKSGQIASGKYPIQLGMYYLLLVDNYPDLIKEYGPPLLYNWRPSGFDRWDGRKEPNYEFKNQTSKVNLDKLKLMLKINAMNPFSLTDQWDFFGVPKLGENPEGMLRQVEIESEDAEESQSE